MMVSGGLAILCHHLAVQSASGYIAIRPTAFSRSAFIKQTSWAAHLHRHHYPITRPHRCAVLFSSATADAGLYNTTNTQQDSLVGGDGGVSSLSPPAALGTSGDWSAYLDETKGLIYYFNQRTGESKWEPPEGTDFSNVQMKISAAKKVEMRERLKSYLEERLMNNDSAATDFMGTMQQEQEKTEQMIEEVEIKPEPAAEVIAEKPKNVVVVESTKKKVPSEDMKNKDIVSTWGEWQALIDNQRGQIYYFNKNTRESSWDKPQGFPEFKLSASKRIALEEQNKRYLEWHKKGATAKVSVLGRGKVVVSESNFDDDEDSTAAEDFNSEMSESTASTQEAKTNKDVVLEPTPPKPNTNYFVVKADDDKETPITDTVESISDEAALESFSIENQPSTLPIVQQGEWSAYYDIKSGLVFYFNEQNGKATWDPPAKDFPRIVMEGNTPKVIDGSVNISQERALGYIGVDEMSAALAWEEAKKKERARKAALRAEKAKENEDKATTSESEVDAANMLYEAAKKAELERIAKERKIEAEAKLAEQEEERLKLEHLEQERIATEAEAERLAAAKLEQEREQLKQKEIEAEAAAKKLEQQRLEKERLEQERIAAEAQAEKEREAAAKQAIQEKLTQERLEREQLEKERVETELMQPSAPKGDPTITVETVETIVAPLKTSTLYDILQCSATASRVELKRAYLSLAKETHPDALLQNGMVTNDVTERRFVEISQAWKILGDPTSRRRYDRELAAKGISSKAGNLFENWVIGAAKAMDEALAKAEDGLESSEGRKKP